MHFTSNIERQPSFKLRVEIAANNLEHKMSEWYNINPLNEPRISKVDTVRVKAALDEALSQMESKRELTEQELETIISKIIEEINS